MTWIEIISAVLGLTCVFLAGRNSKVNFWVGYIYNIFLFVLFWRQHLYSAMLLQPVSFARASVSSGTRRGEDAHRRFMIRHSPSESTILPIVLTSDHR